MCRNATPEDEKVPCWRCGKVANPNDSWEHGWPLTGNVKLGFPSILPSVMLGERWVRRLLEGDKTPDAADRVEALKPELVRDWGFQNIELAWGPNTYRQGGAPEAGGYRLCYDCQEKFLRIVGAFFWTKTAELCKEAKAMGLDEKIRVLKEEKARIMGGVIKP